VVDGVMVLRAELEAESLSMVTDISESWRRTREDEVL
jgi:hypothetical protein